MTTYKHTNPGARASESSSPKSVHSSVRLYDYYSDLRVNANASVADIKKSFYALCKEFHPDSASSTPKHKAKFVRITEAYNVLKDPTMRRQYDQTLQATRTSTINNASTSGYKYTSNIEKDWKYPTARGADGRELYRVPRFSNGTVALFLMGFIVFGMGVNSVRWNSYSKKAMAALNEEDSKNREAYKKATKSAATFGYKAQLNQLLAEAGEEVDPEDATTQ
eukprot:CFRG2589T1